MAHTIAGAVFYIMFPLIFLGIINKTKAVWAGRQGASILQPMWDFVRLMKKGEVISTTTTFLFRIAPSVILSSTILAALLTPAIGHKSLISFEGDFILFAYLLALGRFFALSSAMDTGSSFEGMGASREATFAALIEPAFFITLGSLAAITGHYSFASILVLLDRGGALSILLAVLSVASLFIILLAEGCRVPVDDPNTHLELTMIHEVMILDNSGPDLGMIIYGSALKMVLWCCLIAQIILPAGMTLIASAAGLLAIVFLLAVFIGCIESLTARLRMTHVPQFLFFASSLSMVMMALVLLVLYGGLK